jgi:hypothetical protein
MRIRRVETEQIRDDPQPANGAAGKRRATAQRRSAGFALLATAAALVLAGCGGAKAPSVANLGTTTSSGAGGINANHSGARSGKGGSGSTQARANPSELLVEWAACMRSHGDPDQADPSIDARKVIHIPWNPAIPGGFNGTNKGGQGNSGPGQYCRTYLAKAQSALRGGRAQELPGTGQLVRFAACMRANGIRDFPDPTAKGLQINRAGDLNPNNPAFQNASKVCAHKTGVPGFGSGNPPGTIQLSNP